MTWLPPEIADQVMPKFDWIRMLEAAAASSPLWTHELCGRRCERPDSKRGYVSKIRPSTIAHIGVTLALTAEVDGTRAWTGIDVLAAKTKRHRVTVIAALRHLEVKELLYATLRGGTSGIPRTWATTYALIRPADEVMVAAGLILPEAYEWFERRTDAS